MLCPAVSFHPKKSLWIAIVLALAVLPAIAQDPNPPSIRSNSGAWPIRRQWNAAETQHYAQWVERLFLKKTKGSVEQRGAKLEFLLLDPDMNLLLDPEFLGEGSNPQLPRSIIRSMHYLMDCGKFTAFMPAYYAYRRALPWITTTVTSGMGDIRTSPFNIPVGGVNAFEYSSLALFFENAVGWFISGNYRVNLNGKNAELSDTLPVAIDRKFLMPGCINYVDGHCLLLARVSEYGELYFLNCSTTNTRDIFSYNGMNTVAGITPRGSDPENEWNGCFQGLRVLRYPIAITNSKGVVTKVRRRTNDEMKEFGFSTEQYDLTREMTEKHYIAVGELKPQSLHDFIRLRLKTVDAVKPLEFMEQYVDDLLEAFASREQFIQDAWNEVKKNGPIVYPEDLPNDNIFQALGRWESWSSPSSDVDRRNKYFYLADWMEYAIRLYGIKPSFVDCAGLENYNIQSQSDLAKAMLAEKKRLFENHRMEYTNSLGKKVPLSLLDIEQRLYDLSFDPNHPPELRWGAPLNSDERASAPQTFTPVPTGQKVPMEEAYQKEAFYRSLGQRETDTSFLRDMFTAGFPVRDKLDLQVGKWIDDTPPAAPETKTSAPDNNTPAKASPSSPPSLVSSDPSNLKSSANNP